MTKRLLDKLLNKGMNFHEATTDRLTGMPSSYFAQ